MADDKTNKPLMPDPGAGTEMLLYQSEDGQTRIEVRLVGETLWLTQNQMAELFQVDKSGISRHLDNIYETGELAREATVARFATVQREGSRQVSRELEYYNLDAIISVGYRVNSLRGTQFRIWATQRLREFLVKGFVLDDDRLKAAGGVSGKSYFEELLQRIRDIRASEKVFWRKVLGIYATSIDYDPRAEISQEFFKVVQNKMHWASHGHTAAEIISQRADAQQPNMGLTSWSGDRPRRGDVSIAKNYLNAEEIDVLNRMVTAYLELAELQALNRKPMYMRDWVERLDDFLKMTGREILSHAGTISHEDALAKAQTEYDKYRQKHLNDPLPVERHFIEAVKEVKQLEQQNRRLPKPPRPTGKHKPKRRGPITTMLVLRCTTKVFKKFGGKPRTIDVSTACPTFGDWYVNTVDFINRGDLLACMHVESLYVLFVPLGAKATAEQLVTGLQSRLLARLIELETPGQAAQCVLAAYRNSAVLSKASDRRIAGHMNSALHDLENILDIPQLRLREGTKLLGPRIEHRLNGTPRGITGKNVIWPLTAFWQCVRNLCPELPARVPINLMPIHDKDALHRIGAVLYDNLPDRLAGKLYASFQDVDVLYSADELHTIADALDSRSAFREGLPQDQAQYIGRQVHVKLARLLGYPSAK